MKKNTGALMQNNIEKNIRWKQRFNNFEKSYKLLEAYVNKPLYSEIERAGFIQFFEATIELSWKLLKDYLESEGYMINSPRDTIKTAFSIELIDNGELWLAALADRNLSVHTYDEVTVNRMVENIRKDYFKLFSQLYKTLLRKK